VLEAAAKKEVTRLKEAKDNSAKLADLADEMAAAKEATDLIVDDLVGARDELVDLIQEREDGFVARQAEIDKYRFEADQETDEKKRAQKEAVFDAAVNNLEGLMTSNRNDARLMAQYETQIRSLNNGYLITQA
jgi:hypothetical protein